MSKIAEEFAHVINRLSRENLSNTPDFIIGEFLETVLISLEEAINKRDSWYGKKLEIGLVELDKALNKISEEDKDSAEPISCKDNWHDFQFIEKEKDT